jgi:hypothetical protein
MITPKIGYTYIGLPGLVTMAERTLTILSSRHPDEPFFQKATAKVQEAQVKATAAINSATRLEGTKSVTEADNDRDNSYNSLRLHLKAGLKRRNEAYQQACERLYAIFTRNNLGLARLPYGEQSAALTSLFTDLAAPQAVTDLDTTNSTEWLAELQADQQSFEGAVVSRTEEKATGDTLTDAEASALLIPALKSLFRVLDVAEENEMVDGVAETISQVNVVIAEVVR